ncbi:MAG: transglycosylase SLT domain-containing protein [Campylobacterota bacterium]|nr:transglycosylase SLT domain-containing protein [Campylobacterota bacterium]
MNFKLKVITLFYFSLMFTNASLVNTAFIKNNVEILNELDIDSSFITDYKFQKDFNKRLKLAKSSYTRNLNQAHLFIPKIKKILKENNIPSTILYLAMAESNFNLDAASSKKAKGLWQFMPRTATHFGLESNKYLDERMDIIKSTKAAVTYLKQLHKKFGKWYLAILAYNCGEGRVIQGITRATIDLHCENVGYNVCKRDKTIRGYRKLIQDYQTGKVSFRKLNKIYKEILKWDVKPTIDDLLTIQNIKGKQYVPFESSNYLRKIVSLALMNNSNFLLEDNNVHLLNRGISDPISSVDVKAGIILDDLAELIDVDKNLLKNLNQHITKSILPISKKTYKVYIPYSKLSRYNNNKNKLKIRFQHYKVKQGDNLSKIAHNFKLNYRTIKKMNKLKSNNLKINQELIIPITPNNYRKKAIYTVKKGDTLSDIALKYKVSLENIMKLNNLDNELIKIGHKVVINYE